MLSFTQIAKFDGMVGIVVPSTVKANEGLTDEEYALRLRTIYRLFAVRFGAYSAIPMTGGWLSQTYGLIEEKCELVFAACDGMGKWDDAASDHEFWVKSVAATVRDSWQQECVAVYVNWELSLIEPVNPVQE